MNQEIDILLARYFSGEASPDELAKLDSWLAESDENETLFEEFTTIYQNAVPAPDKEPDMKTALKSFQEYTKQPKQNVILVSIRKYWQLAAIFLLLITVSVLFYQNNNSYIKVTNVDRLADNTIIKLWENSSLTYNNRFSISNRNVNLEGKAHFDIDNNNKNKFIIQAGETYIEDIGTSFIVDAYPNNDTIEVIVESGKVLFYTPNNKGIEIGAKERGIYNRKTKKFFKYLIANESANCFTFDATPLSEVIDIISKHYKVNIILTDDKLASRKISVTFQDESIEKIVNIIAETLSLKVNKKQNTYKLSDSQ